MEFSGTPVVPIDIKTILTLVFYVVIITYIIFGTILYYHWQNYATDARVTTQTYLAFLVVTVPLILIMISSLLLM